MVRSQLLGQAGGFFCRQSSHRPQVRELWEVGRDIIQRRHSVSPPGRNFLSVYHKKSRCNTSTKEYKAKTPGETSSKRLILHSTYSGPFLVLPQAAHAPGIPPSRADQQRLSPCCCHPISTNVVCQEWLSYMRAKLFYHFHDVAHNSFMTLPSYTSSRESEERQLGSGTNPARGA